MPRPLPGLILALALLLAPTACSNPGDTADDGDGGDGGEPVVITDAGTHYQVVLDYSSGLTPREMGAAYGAAIAEACPDFESLMDGYITYLVGEYEYQEGLRRVGELKPNLPADIREEIEGLGESLSTTDDIYGDGKLSPNEVYALNLLSDIIRTCQCSGLGVYGGASADGVPRVARLLDWDGGGFLARLHAVVTIKNGSQSVCLIGYLGHQGAITALNDDGVFAGVLDSPTGEPYAVEGRRSYVLDLRYALETCTDLEAVAAYLAEDSRDYCYNHNVLLADGDGVAVLENNFSGAGAAMQRALRYDDSRLNPGVTWDHDDAVAVVNSFVRDGNHDNHTGHYWNTSRWEYFSDELDARGALDRQALKTLALGYVYSPSSCQHITVFEPADGGLEVNFKPAGGGAGVFETVEIPFD